MLKKSLESRLRRMAVRRGFQLQKSRARDPGSLTYDGYQLIDPRSNTMVFGSGNLGRGFDATLGEIEEFLKTGPNANQFDKPQPRGKGTGVRS